MINKLRSNLSLIVLIAAFFILAGNLGKALIVTVQHSILAVNFPFPLVYGEGPVLDQVLRLAAGENIYRASIAAAPFTITNTPPLYLLLQIPFARIFGPAFWYGRGISVVSLLFAAIFLGLTLYQLSKDWLAAAVGGLLLFSLANVWNWSVLDQVDTLALALSWAGLFAIVRWPERRWGLFLAGFLFTAAIYTQQTFALVAPLTALAWLLQTGRARRAVELLGGVAGASLVIFLGLNSYTRGGFYFNLVTANANIWDYRQVVGALIDFSMRTYMLGLIAFAFLLAERLHIPTPTWPFVLPYYLAAILVTLLVGKAGSNGGYMFELSAGLCLCAGAAIAWMKNYWSRAAALLLITMQVASCLTWASEQYQPKFNEKLADRAEITQLANLARQSDRPILVDEYNGLLPLVGKRLYYQPFEFNQFARSGLWDPTPLMEDLAQQKFTTVLIYFPKNFVTAESPWPGNIHSAIYEYYETTDQLAYNLIFHAKK